MGVLRNPVASTDSGHAYSNMLRCDFNTRELTVWKCNQLNAHFSDIRLVKFLS